MIDSLIRTMIAASGGNLRAPKTRQNQEGKNDQVLHSADSGFITLRLQLTAKFKTFLSDKKPPSVPWVKVCGDFRRNQTVSQFFLTIFFGTIPFFLLTQLDAVAEISQSASIGNHSRESDLLTITKSPKAKRVLQGHADCLMGPFAGP